MQAYEYVQRDQPKNNEDFLIVLLLAEWPNRHFAIFLNAAKNISKFDGSFWE